MIEEKKIIIPTSKYINEDLQKIFGKIPSVLIPVEGNITLLEKISINNNCKIYVISNEGKEMINDLIKLRSLTNVINLEINSTHTLVETLLSIDEFLDGETTILLGDTSIKGYDLKKYLGTDSISYTNIKITNREEGKNWTYFDQIKNNGVKDIIIHDKIESNKNTISIFNGIFNFKNTSEFKKLLHENNSYFDSINKYVKAFETEFIEETDWIDFGDKENFKKNLIVQPRFFNEIEISPDKKKLKKRSQITDKFSDEIYWMTNLPDNLNVFLPKIYDYNIESDPYIEMQFINSPSISEIYMSGSQNYEYWLKVLTNLFQIKDEFNQFTEDIINIDEVLENVYITKTIDRLKEVELEYKEVFSDWITINNKKLKGLKWILDNLKEICKTYLFNIDKFNIIHGDYFFANMLKEGEQILLIDPRGSFGNGRSLYGDPRYDIAKLSHSIRGKYDVIINDNFIIKSFGKNTDYLFTNKNNTNMIEEIFKKLANKYGYNYDKEILLIESLLFISMVPLHSDYKERQKIMLIRGIELFNDFLEVNNVN